MCETSFGQSSDSTYILGHRHQYHSELLAQDRNYWVSLPNKYDAHKTYPVIYLMDGEMYFPLVASIQRSLEDRAGNNSAIVVGINNVARTKELTPTSAYSIKGSATPETSGGAPLLYKSLVNELFPIIEKEYHASSTQRTLIGHSFGGLFASYVLLTHANNFKNFVIIEPSLWWDDNKFLNANQSALDTSHLVNTKKIFWAFAGKNHYDSLSAYQHIQSSLEKAQIQLQTKVYPSENHGSVFIPSLYDGLRFVGDLPKMIRKG